MQLNIIHVTVLGISHLVHDLCKIIEEGQIHNNELKSTEKFGELMFEKRRVICVEKSSALYTGFLVIYF